MHTAPGDRPPHVAGAAVLPAPLRLAGAKARIVGLVAGGVLHPGRVLDRDAARLALGRLTGFPAAHHDAVAAARDEGAAERDVAAGFHADGGKPAAVEIDILDGDLAGPLDVDASGAIELVAFRFGAIALDRIRRALRSGIEQRLEQIVRGVVGNLVARGHLLLATARVGWWRRATSDAVEREATNDGPPAEAADRHALEIFQQHLPLEVRNILGAGRRGQELDLGAGGQTFEARLLVAFGGNGLRAIRRVAGAAVGGQRQNGPRRVSRSEGWARRGLRRAETREHQQDGDSEQKWPHAVPLPEGSPMERLEIGAARDSLQD